MINSHGTWGCRNSIWLKLQPIFFVCLAFCLDLVFRAIHVTREKKKNKLHEHVWKNQIFYERTELHGSVLQWGLDGHDWVLHCSRSGGLSRISQLRSLKRSPLGRWHATSRVFIPPPQDFVHCGRKEEHKMQEWAPAALGTGSVLFAVAATQRATPAVLTLTKPHKRHPKHSKNQHDNILYDMNRKKTSLNSFDATKTLTPILGMCYA